MPDEAAPLYLVLLFLCLLLSALFSGSEAAFLSLRRVGLQRLLSQRVPGAQRVAHLAEYPERFLPTVLLGNTLVNTAAAVLATSIALAFLSEGTAVVVATAGVTVLVLVFGEVVPKSVAVRHPERVASLVVRPFGWVERALLPVAVLLLWVSRGAAKLFGGGSTREVLVEEEIKVLVAAGREAGTVAHHEAEMLENVFRFGDRTVREVMSPRTEMVCVEEGTTLKGFLDLYKRRPHARFPVYSGSIDNIVGVLTSRDVLKAIAEGGLQEDGRVAPLASPPLFVPETKLLSQLLEEMPRTGNAMAMAVDEFGGVVGAVTLMHLVEEVMGPVTRESIAEEEAVAVDQNVFEVSGTLRIDEANERLGLALPEGDYETVGGFILTRLGRIPREGEPLFYDSLTLQVTRMQGRRIERVRFTRRPTEQQAEAQPTPER